MAETGRVTISSPITGSEVDLDGRYIGGTPTTVDIPEGIHTITVKNGSGNWQRELQVILGITITVEARFPNVTGSNNQASKQESQNKTVASCTKSMKSVPVSSSTSGIKQLEYGQEITVISQDRNWSHIRDD